MRIDHLAEFPILLCVILDFPQFSGWQKLHDELNSWYFIQFIFFQYLHQILLKNLFRCVLGNSRKHLSYFLLCSCFICLSEILPDLHSVVFAKMLLYRLHQLSNWRGIEASFRTFLTYSFPKLLPVYHTNFHLILFSFTFAIWNINSGFDGLEYFNINIRYLLDTVQGPKLFLQINWIILNLH